MSGAAAVGMLLQIKPLLHVSELGGLEEVEKPRGTHRPRDAGGDLLGNRAIK